MDSNPSQKQLDSTELGPAFVSWTMIIFTSVVKPIIWQQAYKFSVARFYMPGYFV